MSERQAQEQDAAERRENEPSRIPDEALPDDLVPSEDNPLAEGLPPGESAGIRDDEQGEQD